MSMATGLPWALARVYLHVARGARTGAALEGAPLMMRQPESAPDSVTVHLATTVPETLASSASRGQVGEPHETRLGRVSTSSTCIGPPAVGVGAGAGVATGAGSGS